MLTVHIYRMRTYADGVGMAIFPVTDANAPSAELLPN